MNIASEGNKTELVEFCNFRSVKVVLIRNQPLHCCKQKRMTAVMMPATFSIIISSRESKPASQTFMT